MVTRYNFLQESATTYRQGHIKWSVIGYLWLKQVILIKKIKQSIYAFLAPLSIQPTFATKRGMTDLF
jgi:hypothetical protein